MRCFYKRFIYIGIFLFLEIFSFAQDTPGIKLFKENNPSAAISVLESEIKNNNSNLEIYNYLGIAYCQVGNFTKAIETYERGLAVPGTSKKYLYYNQGIAYYKLDNMAKAVDSFSMAMIADPEYYQPLLNRANAYLKSNEIEKAIADYVLYIEKNPTDPQEPKIRELLALLNREVEIRIAQQKKLEEEARRLKEEEERLAQAKAEQERLAQEAKAREEERRRKLLEEVTASLKESSDTTNMSAGAEDVFTYETESEID